MEQLGDLQVTLRVRRGSRRPSLLRCRPSGTPSRFRCSLGSRLFPAGVLHISSAFSEFWLRLPCSVRVLSCVRRWCISFAESKSEVRPCGDCAEGDVAGDRYPVPHHRKPGKQYSGDRIEDDEIKHETEGRAGAETQTRKDPGEHDSDKMDRMTCTIMATIMIMISKVAGGSRTHSPITIATIVRGWPKGLSPVTDSKIISIIRRTTPAMRPAEIAAFQSTWLCKVAACCIIIIFPWSEFCVSLANRS
jgi:hypothetical protein